MKPDWTKLFALLGDIVPAVGRAQSATALREHVALLEAQLESVRTDYENLEQENTALKDEMVKAQLQTKRHTVPQDFVEHRGALFKRAAGGGYSDQPICPACHSVMNSFHNAFPFECVDRNCKRLAAFIGHDLKRVLAELPRE
jgi:hypothetical protein